MATADTVDLGPAHTPKEDAYIAFEQILPELKKTLLHLRHDYRSKYSPLVTLVVAQHEPEYFAAVEHLSDHDLIAFGPDNVEQVRVAVSAYGVHLFAKLRIPAMPESGPAYVQFRAFIGGEEEGAKLHSIHTEEKDDGQGGKRYRAIFTKDDELEWFDT